NSEYIGIVFKQGTYIPSLLPKNLMNRRDADLSLLNRNTFLLDNQHWEIPTFENADTFIARLVQKKLLAHDAEVSALLQDQPGTLSSRAAQYRFIRATGLSYAAIRQIEKARAATTLIAKGKSALEVIHELGYYDQSHLIRSLKRYIGHTPTELARAHWIGSLLTPAAITPAVKSY
ncbi:MAG TPA: AraC family transcriptional regulator, partial [Pseudomonadales bacterium]|nr:AraC family transcriptional regulator [Pseudomonadales bacterium]